MKRTLHTLALIVALLGFSGSTARAQVPPDTGTQVMRITLANLTAAGQIFNPLAYNAFVNAVLLEQMGDLYSAAENYKIALGYYPESYELGYSLSEVYYLLREPEKALAQLAFLKELDASGYRLQAACYQALGNPDLARRAFLNLVSLEPDNAQAFSFLATAYRARNDIDSTLWSYANLVRIDPTNHRVWNEMGRVQAQRGEIPAAKESFQRSIEASPSPDNMMSVAGLGEIYSLNNQPDSAELIYKRGLEIDPENILLHRQMVGLYVDRDSFFLALPHDRKIVELAPLDRPSFRTHALILFRVDSLNQAD